MESSLTKSEMDAVLQLIQLSGNTAHNFQVFWVNFNPQRKGQIGDEIITVEDDEEKDENREESVGETSSYSSAINNTQEKAVLSEDDEALPRRRKKSRSIADIYTETRPSIKNRRGRKRHKVRVFLGEWLIISWDFYYS